MIALLDALLDRSVVGGYTSLGYRLRHATWSSDPLPPMRGKVVLVTGATSGLGEAAARAFVELGAAVRLLVRDARRGAAVSARLREQTGREDIALVICDLADLTSVRAAAEQVLDADPRIDVLVNNAGVLPAARSRSADGHELTFATNVLGSFLLTELLLPGLSGAHAAPGRVITVSSGGMYSQRLDVAALLDPPGSFAGTPVYARTKRAEVVLTELWAQRHPPAEIVFHSMHPGWADTAGVRDSLPSFHKVMKPLLRTPEQGADTIVWLGAVDGEPAITSGRFWHDRASRPTHLLPWTKESAAERERLWETCRSLAPTDPRSSRE